jgi:general secretion pathway protein G
MKKLHARGFTLIELLVVIAIIGMLAAIVLASLNSARVKSRDARRLSDISELQKAVELYYNDNQVYPNALTVATLVTPGYMSVIPTDPSTAAAYKYAGLSTSVGGTCSSYHLGATLETASNSALSADADAAATANICAGSAADFAGTDPVYDVKP